MLRNYIKEQLEKCAFADLSDFDPVTNTFRIKKYSKPVYNLHKCYLVSLLPHLLSPSAVIATNWNAGAVPPHQFLKIYVSRILGKMIYVDSIAYDIDSQTDLGQIWSGWLPIEEITQIAAF